MGSSMMRLLVIGWLAVLLPGCEQPLEPEAGKAPVQTQAAPPRSPTDPTSWPVTSTRIDISWPDIVNETGWEIHRSTGGAGGTFSLLATTAANVTTYSNVGLTPTTQYCYRIRSFKTSGRKTTFGTFSTTTCATTFGPPGAPSNLNVTPQLYGQVNVAWANSSTNTDGFRVERAAGPEGPWEVVVSVPGWQLAYGDQGRAIEQRVCYRIVAINSYGETPSAVDCTTPPANPGPLAATSPDGQSIALSWVDNSAAEDGFELQRAGDDFLWGVIATLPANTTSYVDRSVKVDTRYWYQVRATKDGGFSTFSNAVAAAAASTVPAAPSSIHLSPYGSAGITMYWDNYSTLADGVRIERSTDNGTSWTTAGTGPATQNWFNEDGLATEQQVCYRIFSFNRLGDSPPSSVVCTTPPAAPTNYVTASIDDQTVEHRWTDNSSVENGYELWLYIWDGFDYYYYPVSLPANTTSYRAGVDEYPFAVAAVKDGGYSDWAYVSAGTEAVAGRSLTATTRRPPASAQRTPPILKTR